MPGSSNAEIVTRWLADPPRRQALSTGVLPLNQWSARDHKRALASGGARSSRHRRPASARLPCASRQEVGFSRLAGGQSGPRNPRPEKHDLAAKIEVAGIPKRYLRSLGAMGFEDVQQLLHLGRLGEQFDAILDDPLLNLSPGHRVAVNGWLRKEAGRGRANPYPYAYPYPYPKLNPKLDPN